MLNILLSALIDPDRRLRSFRRSERLASILVCTIGPWAIVVSAFVYILLCVSGLVVKAARFSSRHVGQNYKMGTLWGIEFPPQMRHCSSLRLDHLC